MTIASYATKADHGDPVEIGLGQNDRASVAEGLSRVLADTLVLTMKTQAVHWNVTGPMFRSVHELTDEQYQDLHEAADDIAERIRALGAFAPDGLRTIMTLANIEDGTKGNDASALSMQLAHDHEALARQVRPLATAADEVEDHATADLLSARQKVHEAAAWMLRALAS